VKTFAFNPLKNNGAISQKPSNPRRRASWRSCRSHQWLFVAYLRLQPIVVTLATMFVVQGVTLLVLREPGGAVSAAYTTIFTGAR
jgi:hypothetical protein